MPVVPIPIVTLRTSWDAYRSLQRYVWLALGNSWEVRLAEEEGVFIRPLAQVMAVGPETETQSHFTVSDVAQTFQVSLYPPEGATAQESLRNASQAKEVISGAIRYGVGAYGHAKRIPLYDYEGFARDLDEAALESDRHPRDYLRVTEFTAEMLRDPEEPDFYSVVARVRCTWRKAGRVASSDQTVTAVTATFEP